MSRKIKLIWDFRGPESKKTAEHHCIHLNEFIAIEKLPFHKVDTELISDFYATAYIIVNEEDMITYRDALKPHRGEVAP